MPSRHLDEPKSVAGSATLCLPGAPADTAEAVAAREGLDLADDLATVLRHTARAAAGRRRTEQSARRRGDGRSLKSYAFTLLSRQAPHPRTSEHRGAGRGPGPGSVCGTRRCRRGSQPSASTVPPSPGTAARQASPCPRWASSWNGMRVKHRLRGGESAFSVLARTAACGRSLKDCPAQGLVGWRWSPAGAARVRSGRGPHHRPVRGQE